MSTDTGGSAVIVFDGTCVLCNGWVRFLLRRDRRQRLRFAAMQSNRGRALLAAHGLDPDDPASFLLMDGDGAWRDTAAIARVLAGLEGGWPMAGRMLRCIPRRLAEPAYRLVARNRYRWFGRHEHCLLPAPDVRARFLD